jgi:hypothetical protein
VDRREEDDMPNKTKRDIKCPVCKKMFTAFGYPKHLEAHKRRGEGGAEEFAEASVSIAVAGNGKGKISKRGFERLLLAWKLASEEAGQKRMDWQVAAKRASALRDELAHLAGIEE